jgi:SAM-dependent methyltransferase
VAEIYDLIGAGYTRTRTPDARIAARILDALGRSETVVNVGAGAGAYEPAGRRVVAVEPSRTMIDQRADGSAPVVQGSATRLPFRDAAFSAALAVLTVHHWPDRERGLSELARVARDGVVLLTWDPESDGFWLVRDYLPDVLRIDRQIFPSTSELRAALGPIEITPVPIAHDCTDGFLGAYWRRPHAYLDERARSAISTFAKVERLDAGLGRLRADLGDGTWDRRYGALAARAELDVGYRLVVSGRLAKGM